MIAGASLLILVPRVSARVQYIFNWMLRPELKNSFRITDDRDAFTRHTGPKCQYGGTPVEGRSLFWPAVSLLFETGTSPQTIDLSSERSLFTPGFQGIREFSSDPFADCFFLLTRYEEYLPFTADSFGRFPAYSSILMKKGLLKFPLADFLKQKVLHELEEFFPELFFTHTSFEATITIDIDQAFAYRSKSVIRTVGSLVKALPFTPGRFMEELSVITGKKADPFDVYDALLADKRKKLPFVFFLLCSTAHNRYDHPVDIYSPVFKMLVKQIEAKALVGIHPSFFSSNDLVKMHQEISDLREIIKKPVTRSRQHYLRIKFPETYRHLIAAGIEEDYSLGYSEEPGFRAGTCKPFLWYDLEKESTTKLKLFPISFLEISFKEHYLKDFEGAWQQMLGIMQTVKAFSGHLMPVWHNHSIAGWGMFEGWTANYKRMIKWIQENIDGE